MERNWDVTCNITPGYWVTCHGCGATHRADELCPCHRDMLIQIQSNYIVRMVRKAKREVDNEL